METCFLCRFINGIESEWNRLDDIVWRTERTTAFISPRWWPNNHGHVIVVPRDHVPNIESIDDDLLAEVYVAAKRVAQGMRVAYACDGTSTRQHNGAAAGQEVDHFHVHVFPRYPNDDLYARNDVHRFATPSERAPYAEKLRAALEK